MDADALEEWANVTNFMIGGLGFSVEEPEITSKFRDFFLFMYGTYWEKQILPYITTVMDQINFLIVGFRKLTNYQKPGWAERFHS